MKTLRTIGLSSMLFLAATPLFAASVSPANTSFSASGSTTLVKSGITVGCTATFVGKTNADGSGAQVTSASFTGGTLCSSISAVGLPWTITAPSTSSATLSGVQVNTPLGGCGPSTVNAGWSNSSSTLTLSNAQLSGGCTVTGTLSTTPALNFH